MTLALLQVNFRMGDRPTRPEMFPTTPFLTNYEVIAAAGPI
jgi:hypothetical protein